jgi:hypothetical protein
MGYKWQPVTVQDMLTFFGISMHYMLFPHTGRRMRDEWEDATRNHWTTYMSKSRYLQIISMLHFNNNEDEEGLARDSLHKVRPLLNIIKKTLGRYAEHGSELSFDEATMACFSRYGRQLISFNPMKPTGKFHFKMYMICCAHTNLTLKIKIHTKTGSDDNTAGAEDEAHDEQMVNKIDQLTLSMCETFYKSGATINMDNYYMSTVCAARLRSKGVYCRGTIQSSRKFVPKSILYTPSEVRTLPRGTICSVVNPEHNMIAIGWLDNKAVHFMSTSDTTKVVSVKRRVCNERIDIPAPVVVANYNKYMGGVDRHDRLQSTFSLRKQHKFKK